MFQYLWKDKGHEIRSIEIQEDVTRLGIEHDVAERNDVIRVLPQLILEFGGLVAPLGRYLAQCVR